MLHNCAETSFNERSLSKPTGAPVPVLDPQDPGQQGRAIISFDGVSKIFPSRKDSAEVKAVDTIDLVVPEGAIVGVIGRSGAGKSTLIRLINGLEQPTPGKVTVDGLDIGSLDERRCVRRAARIGMIFQHFNLLSSRTAFDNIALPLEIAGTPRSQIKGVVEPLLDMVGLADKRDRYPPNSRAARSSASASRARLPPSRRCCCRTRRPRRSIPETTRSDHRAAQADQCAISA